jgi:ABC-type bacteriocin/lantibiotic exporter with double-glycine peptidase domain
MTEVECGLTSLAMVLEYYGLKRSVGDLRVQFGVGRDGASALSIVKAARKCGMRVRAISLKEGEFRHMPLPAIIHWEFNHFVVVERWSKKFVDIVDPADGRRRLTPEEFDKGFTGVVITLEPGVEFQRGTSASRVTLKTYVKLAIQRAPGAMLQVLIASIILQAFGLVTPLLTAVVIDEVLPAHLTNVMTVLGVGMVVVLASIGVTTLLREWVLIYLENRIGIQVMFSFLEHLFSLPFSFFQQRSTGDLLARMNSNNTIRDMLSNQLVGAFLDSGLVITYLIILLWASPPFGLATLVIGLLQMLVSFVTYSPLYNLANRELAAQGKTQGYITEALAGIETLKAAGAEGQAMGHWSNLYFDQLNISIRNGYFNASVGVVMGFLRSSAPMALLWLGAMQVLNGQLSLGTMLALTSLAASFLSPLSSMVSRIQQLQMVQANLERLSDVTMSLPEQNQALVQFPPRLSGRIKLDHVSFQYTPDSPKVLNNINLIIEAGQKVAIVGRTGSGKSTLGKLLLGLYIPTSGQISYDGLPLQRLHYQEVRRQFGAVLQNTTIFSGTILHNITLNNPSMTKDQAFQAAQVAAIHDDVKKMPLGYDTFIGEGGSALSGGQRQRLAIARAVANNPSVLLLDEATSSLDVLTEQRVSQYLESLLCTQIIIAHRLSTVRNADLILVMEQGTIVEGGTHNDLMQHNGYYTRLVQQQLEKKERKSGQFKINLHQLTS